MGRAEAFRCVKPAVKVSQLSQKRRRDFVLSDEDQARESHLEVLCCHREALLSNMVINPNIIIL